MAPLLPTALIFSLFLLSPARAAEGLDPKLEAAFQKAEAFLASSKAEEKKRGFRTIKERAEAGSDRAQVRLAELYYRGHGVEKDVAAAWGWYEKAAEQGSARALKLLSIRYRLGCDGALKNIARADDFLKRARAFVSKENYASVDDAATATECPRP